MKIDRNVYLKKLIDRKGNGLIKIITGLRRVGKSYLLNTIFYDYLLTSGFEDKQIIKFDFTSSLDLSKIGENILEIKKQHRKVNPEKFMEYIRNKCNESIEYVLLLDEVQELEDFELVLNSYLNNKFDVYVTGSNAKFLSSDVITEFRGRGDEIHLFPLSFKECYLFYDKDPKNALDKYMVYGGLPLVVLAKSDEDRISYLKTQVEETYIADLVERYDLKGNKEVSELLQFIASSTSSLINPKKLSNRFKSIKNINLSEPTIANYIDHFEEIFLLKKALRYNVKGSSYLSTPYKIYFEDVGVRNTILNFRQIEKTHLMENVIFNELRRVGYDVDVGEVEIREKIKDQNGNIIKETKQFYETDFVVNRFDKRCYIQSVYDINDPIKKEQELKSLKNINDSFKKILIVSNNLYDGYDNNGFYYLNLLSFLLKPEEL
ncbi:MAG: ATP-binding protein [Clostridia bacterium]|nr:ATP-binding protein [Clostridia bacterium]